MWLASNSPTPAKYQVDVSPNMTLCAQNHMNTELNELTIDDWFRCFQHTTTFGYGSIPINTIFSGMNIHLPTILMFIRGTRFWHTAISPQHPKTTWSPRGFNKRLQPLHLHRLQQLSVVHPLQRRRTLLEEDPLPRHPRTAQLLGTWEGPAVYDPRSVSWMYGICK